MTKRAFMFPGQGSQYVGMARDLTQHPGTAGVFATIDSVLGPDFRRLMFEGPEEDLKQTRNTQAAIFAHSVAVVTALGDARAEMAAGHSLGEYSALVFAGAMSFEQGLRLVRLRGELMQKAGEERPGTMAAIIGLDNGAIEAACSEASSSGVVQPANFNSPGQVVISGSVEGVRKAMELCKARGAKLTKELPVSGAFHSPLMASAREALEHAIRAASISDARVPVYANVTARPVTAAADIRTLLVDQLTHPVRWEESVRAMSADGATSFVEVGPGKVLQGLVKRIVPSVATAGCDTLEQVSGFQA